MNGTFCDEGVLIWLFCIPFFVRTKHCNGTSENKSFETKANKEKKKKKKKLSTENVFFHLSLHYVRRFSKWFFAFDVAEHRDRVKKNNVTSRRC